MKLFITLIALISTLNISAQKKDSTVQYDTVYVFKASDVAMLKEMIMNSKIVNNDGQPLTGNQLLTLLNWMDSRRTLIPKQPKK